MMRGFLALALALVFWGCSSTANEQAPAFSATQGQHPSGWDQVHYQAFLTNPDQCRTCHGQDLSGGCRG